MASSSRTPHRLLDSQDFTAPEAARPAAGLQALPGVRRRHQRPLRHEIIPYHEYPCSPPMAGSVSVNRHD